MSREKYSFHDDARSDLKVKCSITLGIEPFGYRQGQRIATISFNEDAEETSFKQIVLDLYSLKTNCVTILGDHDCLIDLIPYLRKFINYCKINIDLVGCEVDHIVRYDKVLTTYDRYVNGMNENDTIVLIANNLNELVEAQHQAEELRKMNKFVGKIFIVHTYDLDVISYDAIISNSIHYKTRYQQVNQ